MKSLIKTSVFLISLLVFSISSAQEKVNSNELKSEQTVQTKAQNNNTVRSNHTETKATIDQPHTSSQSPNSDASKKGYDYYQSKSDLNSAAKPTKAQDHNSTRSNKTGSVVAPNNSDTGGNPDVKPILPNDKSEVEQSKKK